MSNSSLVNYINISPNRNVPRNHTIDTITIHCVVGQASVEALGELFANPGRQASSNYGVGYDGKIGLYCPESDRSWCSSSPENDNRAITIEVASDNYYPYRVNSAAYEALIKLVADICKRNGIKKLMWKNNPNCGISQQNMTVHRWFAATECPGEYLMLRMSEIASRVNAIIDNGDVPVGTIYRVQAGAFKQKENALTMEEGLKEKGFATYIREENDIYRVQCGAFYEKENAEELLGKLISAGYDDAFIKADGENTPDPAQVPIPTPEIRVGDKVRVLNAIQYDNGQPFVVYFDAYDVIEVSGDRVVIGIGTTVTAAVKKDNLQVL
ncbi:MAG: N-acetylmuramoyl-L-alanine amidase [Lachnospiraceae bacterium]|nr:N-acetylmuramoyl-L-alanine amidase [Lachnospiraceae bacterium]